ncbi:phosphodiester glycosidase family protein [Streptomyces sp. ISL-43]|uniref:phosphodiester glycosidase family protein n=1 Tax=Streptomyces sp. ISL-43 TaxID=2819183 RepID=UPI001BED0EE7|nr:phosphodiester glycosidase family protein [Streptomyces sp. ISL-43]MBT2452836.1 phosphodiester glycosidase family protein [Streptomyces sp. ISL-43]
MTLTTTARRGALATATALTSVLLLVTPGASSVSAAATAPDVTGWTPLDTQYQQLDPGVELFRYKETSPSPLRAGKPRELNVLRIDPAVSAVRIESTYGRKAGESEIVRDQLNQYAQLPLAGINASYFTNEGQHAERPTTPETVQSFGATARDGVLLGAACEPTKSARRSLVLQHGIPYVADLATALSVTSSVPPSGGGSALHKIDDINRNPGGAMTCPRDVEDGVADMKEKDLKDGVEDGFEQVMVDGKLEKVPVTLGLTYEDSHGKTVTVHQDPQEIILFNDRYGMPTPTPGMNPKIGSDNQAGFEVQVEEDGTLTRPADWTSRGGHLVPQGKHILQAIGVEPTAWLQGMFDAKAKLTIDQKVTDLADNRNIPLDESVDILSGGARLMDDGVPYAPGSCGRTVGSGSDVICKDSRTTLGVDDQGRTVFVTVTGTRDEPADPAEALATYDGAFFSEVTSVFKDLKVMDAINLDGGGSTMLLTRDPSNPNNYTRQTGLTDQKHRPVFDSVYVGVGGESVTPGT